MSNIPRPLTQKLTCAFFRLWKKQLSRFLLLLCFIYSSKVPAETADIIVLYTMPVATLVQQAHWFEQELETLGYVQGKNLHIRNLHAQGDAQRAENLLRRALREQRPNLVVSGATMASQVAHRILHDTGIPLLFFTVNDPVGAGLVERLNQPDGGMASGLAHSIDAQVKLQILQRMFTGIRKPIRFGCVYSSYPSSLWEAELMRKEMEKIPDMEWVSRQINYHEVPKGTPVMIEEATQAIRQLEDKIDYWWIVTGPLGEIDTFIKSLQSESHKPVAYGSRTRAVELGALFSLTPNAEASGRQLAKLADSILKGKAVGEIPTKPASRFDLALNLTSALRMGIVIPSDILELAGDNLFRNPIHDAAK